MATDTSLTAPLSGIRVLDFSRVLAGPFCTMNLGDMGAEIIKIEEPRRGDETRAWGPPFVEHRDGGGRESAYYLSVNRNKKSIALNLKSPEGAAIARNLALRSEVVIENFRPGIMRKFGLSFDELHAVKPRLVYCSISAFGQTGPDRDRPGYDAVIQAEAGIMSVTGEPDGVPMKVGVSFTDMVAGLYAMNAVLLALRVVEEGGAGQHIDVSLFDCAVSLLTFQAQSYFLTGRPPRRMGNLHSMITPYETFQTADGFIVIAAANEGLWRAFCRAAGCDRLLDDARFETNASRVQNRAALAEILRPLIAVRATAEWLEVFGRAGVPCGAVRQVPEIMESELARAREMSVAVEHPAIGPLRMAGIPVKFSAAPGRIEAAPPLLGQHTDQVLRDVLGYSEHQIQAARAAQAIG